MERTIAHVKDLKYNRVEKLHILQIFFYYTCFVNKANIILKILVYNVFFIINAY